MPCSEVVAPTAAVGFSAELESLLAECDERHIWLKLTANAFDPAGDGIRYHVLDTAAEGVPADLLARLRERKGELIDHLRRCKMPPNRLHPDIVPFLARNLDCLWLPWETAPPVMFVANGRTYYRLTPRLAHWIAAAFDRAATERPPADRVKLERRRRRFRPDYWLSHNYRPDQIERARRFADVLPTLPAGQHPTPVALLKPIRMPSRNRLYNGYPSPVRVPKPLTFDLPELPLL